MYVAKILGKIVKLSNKDFKKILRKYDITNAVKRFTVNNNVDNEDCWEIKIKCPLCRESMECNGCTFGKFSYHNCGCIDVASHAVGGNHNLYDWGTPLVTVRDTINTEKIRRFLLSKFKKVK